MGCSCRWQSLAEVLDGRLRCHLPEKHLGLQALQKGDCLACIP